MISSRSIKHVALFRDYKLGDLLDYVRVVAQLAYQFFPVAGMTRDYVTRDRFYAIP